jgi:NAD(P)-dependent dehydrogenase (short-subunit alcohol dehydrogenase family)
MPTGWTTTDIPDQHGRMALVTGANTGIGFHQALELARKGAHVLLAARDPERGRTARSAILQELPAANVELVRLDLADLESVRHLADQLLDRDHGLDLLINNAGVMAVPQRQTTAQGFELQLGTNHLGHFALTGRLLPALLARPVSRVVTVSSLNHRMGAIRLDDLQSERGYSPWQAYNQSKLANALPVLRAATDPQVQGGDYYGPGGPGEARGLPRKVNYSKTAHDQALAGRLWQASEALTGVTFPALARR